MLGKEYVHSCERAMSQHPSLDSAVRTAERYIDDGMDKADAFSQAAFEHGLPPNLVHRGYIEHVES